MKVLLICMIIFSALGASAAEDFIRGTLFKKNGAWNIFVESDNAAFKKGVLALIKIPKASSKILSEKAFVEITGHQEKCDSAQACFVVQKIKLADYDPLKNKK